jgi:hypothetical protein
LRSANGKYLLAAAQNRAPLKVYTLKKDIINIPLQPHEVSIEIVYRNGKKQRQECYNGFSFLSQSARFLSIDKHIASVIISDSKGRTRKLDF